MKNLDQTTRVMMALNARLDRVAKSARQPDTLPPFQMPMTPKMREKLAMEEFIKQKAEEMVGGF